MFSPNPIATFALQYSSCLTKGRGRRPCSSRVPCQTKASPPSRPISPSQWRSPAPKRFWLMAISGAVRCAKRSTSTRRLGFLEILKQEVNWREVVVPTSLPSLFVLPRGNTLSQPSEHLLRESTDAFLKDIYNHYDYIIIDSSPVLAADDTTSLAPEDRRHAFRRPPLPHFRTPSKKRRSNSSIIGRSTSRASF